MLERVVSVFGRFLRDRIVANKIPIRNYIVYVPVIT